MEPLLYPLDVYLLEVKSAEIGFGGSDAVGWGGVVMQKNGTGGVLGDALADRIGQIGGLDLLVVEEEIALCVHKDANNLNTSLLEEEPAGVSLGRGTGLIRFITRSAVEPEGHRQ